MIKKRTQAQGRNWCMTINRNPKDFYDHLEALYQDNSTKIRYVCGQLEVADTGQEHFQGYIQLLQCRRLNWLKANINRGAHYEVQRGNNQQARDYTLKEESRIEPFIEHGSFNKGKGTRTDIVEFKDAILKGAKQAELLEKYTMCMAKFPKFYSLVRALNRPERTKELIVRLNYGGTGLGKTRYAYDNFPLLYSIPLTSSSLWFDGYDLQETVLLDDFAGAASKVSLNYTLQLLDRYPVQVPVKGAYTWWMPTLIIITTNIHPKKWYSWTQRQGQYSALMRRITEIWYFEEGSVLMLEDEQRQEFIDHENFGEY